MISKIMNRHHQLVRVYALLSLLLTLATTTNIQIASPDLLGIRYPAGMAIHVSPIGFKPMSGTLDGRVVMADPAGACSKIQDLHGTGEDLFVLADDVGCLESVKAKNIASSGAYVGLIRRNLNNTLHDKQINLVHIPIVELEPQDFDQMANFIQENDTVIVSIDFYDNTQSHPINIEVWFSPTETPSYEFILDMQEFMSKQEDRLSFTPHYALQSQRDTKNYMGCLSSGRYCPTEVEFQGKHEGINVVEEALRQIIVWKMSKLKWWKYIKYYKDTCLSQESLFYDSASLEACADSCLIMAGISINDYKTEYNSSFLGPQKEVADNTYLLEERQLQVKEQLSMHPSALVNKKFMALEEEKVQDRVCKLQVSDPSSVCLKTGSLSTNQVFVVVLALLAAFSFIAGMYRLYLHFSMKREIKSEVDSTLQQYYRYIETFEGQDGQVADRKSKGKKGEKGKSRPLTEALQEVDGSKLDEEERGHVDIEMREMEN